MKRKIISGLMVVCMMFGATSFVGCGEKTEASNVSGKVRGISHSLEASKEAKTEDIPTLEELLDDESFRVTVGDKPNYEPIDDPAWETLLRSTKPLEMNESYTENWSKPLAETRLRPYLRYFDMPGESPQATYEFVETDGGKAVKINCNGAPGGTNDYVNFRGMRFTAGAYYNASITYTTLTAGANYYLGFDHFGARIVDMPSVEVNASNTVKGMFKASELYDNNSIASLTVGTDGVDEPSSVRVDSITITRIDFVEEDTRSLKLEIGESITEDFERYNSMTATGSVFGAIAAHNGHDVNVKTGFDGKAIWIGDAKTNYNFTAFFYDTRGKFNAGRYRVTLDVQVQAIHPESTGIDIGMLDTAVSFATIPLSGLTIGEVSTVSGEFYFTGSATEYFFFGCKGADVYIDNVTLERIPMPGVDSLKNPGDSVIENFDDFVGFDGKNSVIGTFHSNCFDSAAPEVKDNVQIVEDPAGGNYLLVDDSETQMDTNLHFLGTKGKFAPGTYQVTVQAFVEVAAEGGRLDIGFLGAGWNGQTRVLTAGEQIVELDPVMLVMAEGDTVSYLYMGCLRAKIRIESITITRI